ncbi:MAG: helix-turn-helix transcriptional regulator [Clostridiales bacterium]|nr:helix-turn-helix transcriptional regulator [Clostridiales bacterium]
MEIGKRIRELRNAKGWNQELFAEKTYVSRQTVSSWENDKSYPDIKSLLLMSELFEVSLDDLIKGDVVEMKKEISNESIREFQKWSNILAVMYVIGLIIPYPLAHFFGWWGILIFVLYWFAALVVSFHVEALKKKNDIQTYKEIVAFTEGKELDKDEKIAEKAKRPYQKVLLGIGSGALALAVCILMHLLLG